ncbi:unnamed protein product [Thlaspi arvense]|uniref:Uncharacterized protein n=1 Tax=Thlaspi arvense TaxID=13288 RepID=A0AAU9RXT7_THLAR|nr:unnamed protein product [Thlaspi arvense]
MEMALYERNGLASFFLLSLEETMVSRQFCSKEEKRNIHIIRGREVMSIRRCACFMVYTRGISPTHSATQTIIKNSISLVLHNSLFGSEGSYTDRMFSHHAQGRNKGKTC